MSKLILIIPYYGPHHPWETLFFKSVEYLHSVDILFITDGKRPNSYSSNVKTVYLSFEELKYKIDMTLGFCSSLQKPYKLCDFKPALGDIFKEEIQHYSYWGYCDIDMIFGNIDQIVDSAISQKIDVVTSSSQYLSGHFTMLKNCEALRELYKNDSTYLSVFRDDVHWGFDEISWFKHFSDTDLTSFSSLVKQAEASQLLCVTWGFPIKDGIMSRKDTFFWEKGELIDAGENQYAYYHWNYMKNAVFFRFPTWSRIPHKYRFDFFGFYKTNNFLKRNLERYQRMLPRNFERAIYFFKTHRLY